MINFSTLQGLTIPEGVVTQIADASGMVLWAMQAGGWPDDIDTGLEFASASAFTISASSPGWDGTMAYSNGEGWKTWDGSAISSGEAENGQRIYLRGTGNTKVAGESANKWTLTGTGIKCNGNIEKLLDYVTVCAGEHPAMARSCYSFMFFGCTGLTTAPSLPATTLASYCYHYMFYGCTGLTTAPSLPATTLASSCYSYMFYGCTGLTTAPSLPATTLATSCYQYMFFGCKKIKLSETQTGEYQTAYRIPTSGTGTKATNALYKMFTGTGGTFKSSPSINTTYYLDSSNTIV